MYVDRHIIMPVDDTILNDTITAIKDEILVNRLRGKALADLYNNAVSIALQTVSDATLEYPQKTKLVLPNDSKLGTEITEERRQEICDKVIADFAELD